MDPEEYEALSYVYVMLTAIAVIAESAYVAAWSKIGFWTPLRGPPPVDYVEVLGMRLPIELGIAVVLCHAMLIPWTAAALIGSLSQAEWMSTLKTWLTFMGIGATIVENMYRGPYTPLVFCICFFDAVDDIFAGASTYFNLRGRTGIPAIFHLAGALSWGLFAMGTQDIFTMAFAGVHVLGNLALTGAALAGNDGAGLALEILRGGDLVTFALLGLFTGELAFMMSALTNLVAFLTCLKSE